MSEIKCLEYPLLKVPCENMQRKYCETQKIFNTQVKIFDCIKEKFERNLNSSNSLSSVKDISRQLNDLIEVLKKMKKKTNERVSEEISMAQDCQQRISHLKQYEIPKSKDNGDGDWDPKGALEHWKQNRLNRFMVEHFLSLGYYDTAELLGKKMNILHLTNFDVFQKLRDVEEDLKNHKTDKCYEWVKVNKTRLKRINSDIEFNLHVQEFVELIRADKQMDAITYARKYFPAHEDYMHKISECMALITFDVTKMNDIPEPYKTYMAPPRWNEMTKNLRKDNYRLYRLPAQSLLSIICQTGLSALKNRQCYSSTLKHIKCPVCQDFNEIAEELRFAQNSRSYLICRFTGAPINENNSAMVLPNGQIYGESALAKMKKTDTEKIICPETNEEFDLKDVKKIFFI